MMMIVRLILIFSCPCFLVLIFFPGDVAFTFFQMIMFSNFPGWYRFLIFQMTMFSDVSRWCFQNKFRCRCFLIFQMIMFSHFSDDDFFTFFQMILFSHFFQMIMWEEWLVVASTTYLWFLNRLGGRRSAHHHF